MGWFAINPVVNFFPILRTTIGNLNHETSFDFSDALSYNADDDYANFHLLGNPFTFDMDITKATFTNMVNGVAIITSEGGYDYSQTTIPVGDGFFVQAIEPANATDPAHLRR